MKRQLRLITSAVLLAALASACAEASGAEASEVTFDVALIEIKGSTDAIPPPSVDPTSLSQGYRYKAPGVLDEANPAKWEVSTYMFSPGAMTVVEGDEVTLRMFGTNGDEHVIYVEAPDGTVAVPQMTTSRGSQALVTFTADQAGHYTLWCVTHAPTMQADILSMGG